MAAASKVEEYRPETRRLKRAIKADDKDYEALVRVSNRIHESTVETPTDKQDGITQIKHLLKEDIFDPSQAAHNYKILSHRVLGANSTFRTVQVVKAQRNRAATARRTD